MLRCCCDWYCGLRDAPGEGDGDRYPEVKARAPIFAYYFVGKAYGEQRPYTALQDVLLASADTTSIDGSGSTDGIGSSSTSSSAVT